MDELLKDLKGKSILITGGSGFFGKNLCSALVSLNASQNLNLKIYALARTPVIQEGVHFIQHDVTQLFSFNESIDLIIHAATPVVSEDSHFEKTIDIIVNGTQQCLRFAEHVNCKKFLLVSSGAVYGEQPEELKSIPEDYTAKDLFYNFKSGYTTGKRISELMALDWAKRTRQNLTIARCFAFSGKHLPLDQHFAIGDFVGEALRNKIINIKGDGRSIRSYMDADDLVLWLLTILLKGENGEAYNVGSDQEMTIKELAYKIAEKFPQTKVVIQNSESEKSRRSKYVPCIEKAKNQLNLKINVSLENSILKMIDFNRGLL